MRTRLAALLAAALFWAGCASTPATPPTPAGPPPPPPLRPLSPEAAAFFARAEQPGPGAALVVNLDALESLGLLGRGNALRQLASLFGATLPQLVTVGEEKDAALLARGAVAASVLRHWAEWPSAQRLAVLVSHDFLHATPTPRPAWGQGVVALAVEERSPDNAKLLVGLAVLGRSVTEELSREGAEVRLSMKGTDLCMESAELEVPVCLRPRRGLLLLGAPAALDAAESATRPDVPVSPAATEAPAQSVAAPAPLLVGLQLDMGKDGRASLAFTGRDAVHLAMRVEGVKPQAVATIDRVVAKFLRDYDTREVQKRERIGAALSEVRGALAQDAAAPAELKEAARALTVEQVVDEKGYWARMRQSVKIENSSRDGYALSLTVPEGFVRDFAEQMSGGGVMTAGTLGVLGAVAIPNFLKFQARSKQSEVKANLKAAYVAQRSYAAEKDRYGRTFRDIGFAPEPGRRYTYCMGTECLPCDRQGCAAAPALSPCRGIAKVGKTLSEGFTVCAYGNVDQDEDLDVWVIDEDGEPQQLNSDAN